MKRSLGISNFLEEISSLSHSVVFLYLFAWITEEGFLISEVKKWNEVAQSCLTLCDPMDYSLPGSNCGVFQARILEWVTILFSRASSRLRDLPDSGIKPGSPALQADALLSELPLLFGSLDSNGYIFPFLLCFSLLFFSQLFVKPPLTTILPFFFFLHLFFLRMVLIIASWIMYWITIHSSLALCLSDLIP